MPGGLDVYVLPKEGFNKTYAVFTTKYGSIDNQFVPLGKDEMVRVPDGIAHFLEHKLFEKKTATFFSNSAGRELRQMRLPPSQERPTCFQARQMWKKTWKRSSTLCRTLTLQKNG